jgi:hypothetical protein
LKVLYQKEIRLKNPFPEDRPHKPQRVVYAPTLSYFHLIAPDNETLSALISGNISIPLAVETRCRLFHNAGGHPINSEISWAIIV